MSSRDHLYGMSRRAASFLGLLSSVAERIAQTTADFTAARPYHARMTTVRIIHHRCPIVTNAIIKQPYLSFKGSVSCRSFCSTPSSWVVLASNAKSPSKISKAPKKTRKVVSLDDLPQGLLASPKTKDVVPQDVIQYPPVIQQVRNNIRKYDGCVILTRVGNFYEMYLEQAEEYGPLLNLKVAQKKTGVGNVPMSGFQYQYLLKYLRILVMDLHKHVVISEEIPLEPADRAKSGGHIFDRKVKRVITAGTLTDEDFLNPNMNNYLLSIHMSSSNVTEKLGLAWLDLSSSNFSVETIDIGMLASALARISPSEVVLDSSLKECQQEYPVFSILKEARCRISWHAVPTGEISSSTWSQFLECPLTEAEIEEYSAEEMAAAGVALHYVQDRLQNSEVKLQPPVRRDKNMSIDKYSIKALEIKTTLRDDFFKGSLLHVLRKTITKSGSRMLTDNLMWPSLSLAVINHRLDLVETFVEDVALRYEIQELLKRAFDASRLLTRFSLGLAEADDLLELSKTIQVMVDLVHCIEQYREDKHVPGTAAIRTQSNAIFNLMARIDIKGPKDLAKQISDAVDEDGLSETQLPSISVPDMALVQETQDVLVAKLPDAEPELPLNETTHPSVPSQLELRDEFWIMKRHASTRLKKLHGDLDRSWAEHDDLMREMQRELGVPTVALKWKSGLGYFGYLKHRMATKIIDRLEGARLTSSSKSTASFQYPLWSQLGERMEDIRVLIRTEEQKVFSRLCDEVEKQIETLRRNAKVLDELDVACSNATVASTQNWVRPILHSGTSQTIVGGRHPMVDLNLAEKGRGFTANDCRMNSQEKLLFITGPNMAGKSTFLRQNALITILAQTGSFVPATYAEIGLVDKVFSRVGSADNLSRDQSTFMVEMLESAEILRNATERSFVIMDEVGRGTTPEDGIALGFACLDHLARANKCRALFATHFHVLADLTKGFGNVGYYCTDVVQDGSDFAYDHQLRPGVNRESHALKVARLAGLPEQAIEVAASVLKQLNAGGVPGLPKTKLDADNSSQQHQAVHDESTSTNE
ncbi:MAG: DNA mismatch repair ATPase msh1 [Bathelium mastoideum]|nr:MAG: DNA mismatch repair ATPase msh1 [Bathelium mastoideum]